DVAHEVAQARQAESAVAARALGRVRFTAKLTPALFQYAALAIIVAIIWILVAVDYDDIGVIGPLILLLVRALAYARQLQNSTQSILHFSPYVELLEEEIAQLRAHPLVRGATPVRDFQTMRVERVDYEYTS